MCGTNNKIKIECTEEEEKATVTCKNLYTVLKNENLYHIKEKFKTTYDVLNSLNSNFKQIELRKEFKKDGAIIYNSKGKPIMVIDIHTGDTIKVPTTISKTEVVKGNIKEAKSSSCAPWMKIVLREKGVRLNGDDTKNKGNSRIEEYLSTALAKGEYTYETSWCGAFVNWVMLKTGYKQTVTKPAWALNWSNFGKKITSPVYGAIGVKSRITKEGKRAGHVSFVIGISEDGKDIFMLGGNQGGASILEIKTYSLNNWNKGFYFPDEADETKCTLEVYRGYALPKGRGD